MADYPICYEARRHWGSEYLIVALPSRYTIKLLRINEGFQGGLQYHHLKVECGVVLRGKLTIRSINADNNLSEKILAPNDFFFFPPGFIHQEHAIQETYILEVSTPHFNDRVRLDHEISPENELPSTEISDVFCLTQESDLPAISSFGFEKINPSEIPILNLIKL